MQLIVDVPSMATNRPEIIIEHKGIRSIWNVVNFDKRVFTSLEHDVIKHINLFWFNMPIQKQDQVFELYNTIRNTLEYTYDTTSLTQQLLPLVNQLYTLHPIEDFEHWISWSSGENSANIIIPDRFEIEYIDSDEKGGSREKTYTRHDYVSLVALTLQLRLMIPIWGEFIYRTKGDAGTNFKEYQAFQLLVNTSVMNSVPMLKLKTYVQSNIAKEKSKTEAVLSGIGSEDYPIWLLALVIVRRLCIGDVTGSNPVTNLVTFIFNFISQKVAGNNNSAFGQMVKEKKFEAPNASGEHNVSRTEGYKIKQSESIGDIAVIEYFMNDPINVANLLDPMLDKKLVLDCLSTCQVLQNSRLEKSQILLTQWVLANVVPPRGISHLTKPKMINAIAITQAWLWQYGHSQLSGLVSAMSSNSADEMQLSGVDSRARITREQMVILEKIYPFSTVRSSKQKTKPTNSAVQAIDLMAIGFGQRDWILTQNEQHSVITTGHKNYKRYSCPHDIKILLANLVIFLKRETILRLNNQPM